VTLDGQMGQSQITQSGDVPVMEVFDQTAFIEKRNKKIK
jgi:hypothetical protein